MEENPIDLHKQIIQDSDLDIETKTFLLSCDDDKFVSDFVKQELFPQEIRTEAMKEESLTKRQTAVKNLPTAELCRLRNQGMSVKKIAERYNCAEQSVRYHLKKAEFIKEITMDSRKDTEIVYLSQTSEQKQRMFNDKISLEQNVQGKYIRLKNSLDSHFRNNSELYINNPVFRVEFVIENWRTLYGLDLTAARHRILHALQYSNCVQKQTSGRRMKNGVETKQKSKWFYELKENFINKYSKETSTSTKIEPTTESVADAAAQLSGILLTKNLAEQIGNEMRATNRPPAPSDSNKVLDEITQIMSTSMDSDLKEKLIKKLMRD